MEQKNLIAVARKWWVVLLAAAVVGGLVARAVAAVLQPTYESTVRLLTGPTSADVNTLDAAGGLARTYSELATSQPQLQAVAREIGLHLTPDQLAEDVQSTSNDVTRVVAIRVRRPTAQGAQEFAKRLGERMVALSNEGSKRDAALADELLRQDAFTALSEAQRRDIRAAASTVLGVQRAPGTLTVVDPPRLATGPVSPKTPLLVLLGALCGLALAGAVIVGRERQSGTIDDARSLAATVDAPVLATVSGWDLRSSLVVRSTPGSAAAGEMRRLADQISYLARDGSVRSVVLIGAGDGGPSGVVAANLGAALAAPDFRVVVVDADPDRADVTHLFRLSNHSGLSDFVRGGDRFDGNRTVPDILGVVCGADLTVIPAGAPGGARGRLDSRRVREIVESLQSECEMVLVVPPASEYSSDALVWAEQTDGTVIVAEQRATATGDIVRVRDRVMAVRARIIGTVFFGTRAIPGLGRLTDRRPWGRAKSSPRAPSSGEHRERLVEQWPSETDRWSEPLESLTLDEPVPSPPAQEPVPAVSHEAPVAEATGYEQEDAVGIDDTVEVTDAADVMIVEESSDEAPVEAPQDEQPKNAVPARKSPAGPSKRTSGVARRRGGQ